MFCAAFGCLLGDLFGGAVIVSLECDVMLFRVLDQMTLGMIRMIMFEMITFIDVVFYVIAMFAAYRIAVVVE